MNKRRNNVKRGFTLIEILIVVVILGILAAIIIPQFTDAAQDAGASSARSQLQTMRSQIGPHRVHPNGAAPADDAAAGALTLTCDTAAAPVPDVDGNGTSEAADVTAIEAW